jgi:hypothetical protein
MGGLSSSIFPADAGSAAPRSRKTNRSRCADVEPKWAIAINNGGGNGAHKPVTSITM